MSSRAAPFWLSVASFSLLGIAEGRAAPVAVPATPAKPSTEKPAARSTVAIFAQCRDGSTLKVVVRDEKLEMITSYGKLLVPMADIQRVEVATRIPQETTRRVEIAIANLGKSDFKQRDVASAELLELQDQAFPALVKAAAHADAEIARRAKDLVEKIRAAVPAELLEYRAEDIVHTRNSKIAGQLAPTSLRVTTVPFGDQNLKLADVLEISTKTIETGSVDENVLPDPGSLHEYQAQVGKTISFRVTGGVMPQIMLRGFGGQLPGGMPMMGPVWGTDIYTLDSALSAVVIHAGLLKQGQTGVVKVTIVGPQNNFIGSTRNGVTSQGWLGFPAAFRVTK